MANDIAFASNFTGILGAVYQRASVSRCPNSGRRIVQASRHAKEIKTPKISVTGLGDYVRNQGYKTGSITYEYETKVPNHGCGVLFQKKKAGRLTRAPRTRVLTIPTLSPDTPPAASW